MSHKALARDSPGSILRKLKQLDESERVLHAKLLALSAERALLVSSLSELLQNDESETASSASTPVGDLESAFEDDLSLAQERSLDYVRNQQDACLSHQSVENVWGTEGYVIVLTLVSSAGMNPHLTRMSFIGEMKATTGLRTIMRRAPIVLLLQRKRCTAIYSCDKRLLRTVARR